MASALKNLSAYDENDMPSAKGMQFGIVVSDYHNDITFPLFEACRAVLIKHGAAPEDIHVAQVPGAFELTAGARMIAQAKSVDAVICLGCVITGETPHNEYINMSVAQGLTNMGIASGKPFLFGLLTPNDHQQALDRAGGKHGNKGTEVGVAAIRMVDLKKTLGQKKGTIGF